MEQTFFVSNRQKLILAINALIRAHKLPENVSYDFQTENGKVFVRFWVDGHGFPSPNGDRASDSQVAWVEYRDVMAEAGKSEVILGLDE